MSMPPAPTLPSSGAAWTAANPPADVAFRFDFLIEGNIDDALNALPTGSAVTRPAVRPGLISRVFATLSQSRRTVATPKAVLISIGHSEQMKITKIDDSPESLMV